MHANDHIFRDLHPTRIHFHEGVVKWNLIGMPYNFKKLLKDATFTGHLNYTAVELIKDSKALTKAADIWALGCCFFFLATKRDPFTPEHVRSDPKQIKKNIIAGIIDVERPKDEPNDVKHKVLHNLLAACLEPDSKKRVNAAMLLKLIDEQICEHANLLQNIQIGKRQR